MGWPADFAVQAMDEHTVLATDTVTHLSDAFRYRVKDEDGLTWICGLTGMKEKRFKTRSEAGTLAMGERMAEMLLPAPKLIVLRGDVGAGKTTLVKGVAAALGAAEASDVTSPTFTLVHEYVGPKVRLYHLDLYRLETERELLTSGARRDGGAAGCAGAGGVGGEVSKYRGAGRWRDRDRTREWG